MTIHIRAAAQMAVYCFLAFLLHLSMIPSESYHLVLLLSLGASVFAGFYPQKCFPWLGNAKRETLLSFGEGSERN